ncbi:NAD(P)/FAD-dependent oxidoreductase [Oceanicoccus sagamiensis]|uniref:Tat pathway signal protein n=1 Tax=Oceanicoccus sagamiensis TaxID=716816 RepID=A0A1X9NDQ2_9GAMM|nr:FAD/NAD(P)-binding protein [Oceanicoccus sagamiensis]ARN73077.1 Tat pathway signal protein [Oceanicoccus sagamiensis]
MTNKVTRRDFLNGMAIGATGILLQSCGGASDPSANFPLPAATQFSPPDAGVYYPPTLTGMRGSHKGSYEVAHALAWRGEKPDHYKALDEHYDLVVVGAGMSGLAAAHYYRKKMGPEARILLLDNHDDFGGHAKRNEFHHEGRMMLSLGGAQNLENPDNYSDTAGALLNDIGIDADFTASMNKQTPKDFALVGNFEANVSVALPSEDGHVTAGGQWMKSIFGADGYEETLRALPLAVAEQDKLIAFFSGDHDFLDELSLSEKWDYVNTVSYNQFLVERVGLAKETLPLTNVVMRHTSGFTGWNLTVVEAFANGAPGIQSMGWLGKMTASLSLRFMDSIIDAQMFPDGNASVARLLVQKLIPEVAPDMKGVEDVAIARFDYSALDPDSSTGNKPDTRIRLNSTVVGVRETHGDQVEVDYVQQGTALRITADHCVLACYNALIPRLCPQLPEQQKEALLYGVKVPFVYANVLLENGRAFSKLDSTMVYCPNDPFQWVSAAPTMTTGGYQPPRTPEDPMAVFMMHAPTPEPSEQQTGRDVLRVGRGKVYATPFSRYEQNIREQLQSLLGKHGFNHETDIRAITVNRIPHGYAYAYLSLDDPEWPEGQAPHEIGRKPFGRISIANSDSQALALMDAAFDAAWRAVEEQTA